MKIYHTDTLTSYRDCEEEFGGTTVALVYASHKKMGGGYKNHRKGQEEFIWFHVWSHTGNYSNITRLKGLRKADFERMEKYHKAFVYLSY